MASEFFFGEEDYLCQKCLFRLVYRQYFRMVVVGTKENDGRCIHPFCGTVFSRIIPTGITGSMIFIYPYGGETHVNRYHTTFLQPDRKMISSGYILQHRGADYSLYFKHNDVLYPVASFLRIDDHGYILVTKNGHVVADTNHYRLWDCIRNNQMGSEETDYWRSVYEKVERLIEELHKTVNSGNSLTGRLGTNSRKQSHEVKDWCKRLSSFIKVFKSRQKSASIYTYHKADTNYVVSNGLSTAILGQKDIDEGISHEDKESFDKFTSFYSKYPKLGMRITQIKELFDTIAWVSLYSFKEYSFSPSYQDKVLYLQSVELTADNLVGIHDTESSQYSHQLTALMSVVNGENIEYVKIISNYLQMRSMGRT